MGKSERLISGLSGILFGPLVLAGFAFSSAPGGGYDAKDVASYLDTDSRSDRILALVLLLLAAILLIRFMVGIHARLQSANGESTPFYARIAALSGTAWAAAIAVGACTLVAVPLAMGWDGMPAPAPEVTFVFGQLGYLIVLAAGGVLGFSALLSIGLLAGRGAFPGWVRWFTWLLALPVLMSWMWFTMLALPIWSIVMGAVLLRTPKTTS